MLGVITPVSADIVTLSDMGDSLSLEVGEKIHSLDVDSQWKVCMDVARGDNPQMPTQGADTPEFLMAMVSDSYHWK